MAAVLKPQPVTAAQVLDECCRSTEEQQRLAYRELFRPLLWPDTFEAAMARKPFRVAICAVARNRNRVSLRDVAKLPSTLPRGVPVPPTPGLPPNDMAAGTRSIYSLAKSTPTPLSVWPTKLGADVKRLAANDKDDA